MLVKMRRLWDAAARSGLRGEQDHTRRNIFPADPESGTMDSSEDGNESESGGKSPHDVNFQDKAPNILLNLHNGQEGIELFVVAIIGVLLQAGVLAFSSYTAYNPR